MITEGYPLQFPTGWKRTKLPVRASFRNHTISDACNYIQHEIRKLGGTNIIISSNLRLNLNGSPASSQRNPEDRGVAVYFTLQGNQQCFPCDRWDKIEHNLWAVFKSIEAIRGLERWGAKEMVAAAFSGFKALPAPENVTVSNERYFSDCTNLEYLGLKYKKLLRKLHPDNQETGDSEQFQEMMIQYKQARGNLE